MVSGEIIKVLDNLGEKFGIVIDWTQQNVQPYLEDLCQRTAQYKLSSSIVGLAFGTLLLIGGIICLICTIKITIGKYLKMSSNDTRFVMQCLGYAISILMVFTGIIFTITNVNNICEYSYLPEKALIEIIKSI